MSNNTRHSPFARALRGLLDDTQLFTRDEWAEYLRVSTASLSQWVNDRTIPRSHTLFLLYDTLRGSDVPSGPLVHFQEIAAMPATEASPHGRRMQPNVWSYMHRPEFERFIENVTHLPPAAQERVFQHAANETATAHAIDGAARSIDAGIPTTECSRHASTVDLHTTCVAKTFSEVPIEVSSPIIDFPTEFIEPRFRVIRGFGTCDQELSLVDISKIPCVFIEGSPGSGKTTLVTQLLHRHFRELKGASAASTCVIHASDLASAAPDVNFWNASTILCDAYDEVPEASREQVQRRLKEWLARNKELRVVITSRPLADKDAFPGFSYLRLEPLKNEDVLRLTAMHLRAKLSPRVSDWQIAARDYLSHLLERHEFASAISNPLFLSIATSLFSRHAVTAAYESEVLDHCFLVLVDEWDRRKKISRIAEPWGLAQNVRRLLSGVCYGSVVSGTDTFLTSDACEWVEGVDVLDDRRLRMLAECSGVIEHHGGQRWRVNNIHLQELLAARYVVESCRDARNLIVHGIEEPRMRRVAALACSMSNDANDLVEFVLKTKEMHHVSRMWLLAEMLSHPIKIDATLMERVCDDLIAWSEESVAGWIVDKMSDRMPAGGGVKWQMLLRHETKCIDDQIKQARGVLWAIRTARAHHSAREFLEQRLRNSRSVALNHFAESISVEGAYYDRLVPGDCDRFLSGIQDVAVTLTPRDVEDDLVFGSAI